MKRELIALALIMVGAGCERVGDGGAEDVLTAAETAVAPRLQAMDSATEAGSVDGLLALWAEDVRILESGVVMENETAARDMMQAFLSGFAVKDLSLHATETIAHDSGTVVYQFGYLTQSLVPKQGGPGIPVRNNFAVRWVKDPSGTWVMHRYIATAAPADAAAPPQTTNTRAADAPPESDPITQVAERLKQYEAAANATDATQLMSFWSEDGQLYEAENQQIGKAAITAFVQDAASKYKVESASFEPLESFVHDNGNVVYQLGSCTEKVVDRATNAAMTANNNYLIRWRRQADGNWLIDRFISTAGPER